jgi:hypothetical protein
MANWVTVDDTGARHRGANAVCTQIGNDSFAWFGTTGSKSRLNFLDLLRAGHTDYVINDAALDYTRRRWGASSVLVHSLGFYRGARVWPYCPAMPLKARMDGRLLISVALPPGTQWEDVREAARAGRIVMACCGVSAMGP